MQEMSPLYVKVFHGCIQKLSSSWYFSWNYFLRLQFSHCVILTWSKVTLLLFSAHWQPSSSSCYCLIFISQHVLLLLNDLQTEPATLQMKYIDKIECALYMYDFQCLRSPSKANSYFYFQTISCSNSEPYCLKDYSVTRRKLWSFG